MIPEKRKVKNEEAPILRWLYRFVSPLQMDMVIPRSLETCVELLQRKQDRGFWAVRKTTVEITKVGDDTYELYIKQWSNGPIVVEAKGYLNDWQEDTTHIIAEINLTRSAYRSSLPLTIVFALFFIIFFSFRFFPDGIILTTIGIFFFWDSMRGERHNLKRLIEDTLQPEIRKKKKR